MDKPKMSETEQAQTNKGPSSSDGSDKIVEGGPGNVLGVGDDFRFFPASSNEQALEMARLVQVLRQLS
jgi:hypothetical protein